MKFFEYLKLILHESVRLTSEFIGITSKSSLFRTVLIWAITTLLIFTASENNIFFSRIRLGLASLLSILTVSLITFIFSTLYSPFSTYKKLFRKFKTVNNVIKKAYSAESKLRELSDLYYAGKKIYLNGFTNENSKEKWITNLENWVKEVETILEKKFSISEIHNFRQMHDFSHYRIKNMPEDSQSDNTELLSKYSAYSDNLNDIIKFSPTSWETAINGAINEQEEKQI